MQACFIVFLFFYFLVLSLLFCSQVHHRRLWDVGNLWVSGLYYYSMSFLAALKEGSQLFKSVSKQVIKTGFACCNHSSCSYWTKDPFWMHFKWTCGRQNPQSLKLISAVWVTLLVLFQPLHRSSVWKHHPGLLKRENSDNCTLGNVLSVASLNRTNVCFHVLKDTWLLFEDRLEKMWTYPLRVNIMVS